jgi:hypothetical protein
VITSAGLLPRASPGVALQIDAALSGPLRWTVGALWLSEALTADGRFAFGMVAADGGVCAAGRPAARLSLSACAALLAGSIHAVVYSPIPLAPGERVWLGASAGGAVAARVAGPVTVDVHAALVAPFIHRQFLVAGEPAAVFEERAVAAVAGAGLGLQFR